MKNKDVPFSGLLKHKIKFYKQKLISDEAGGSYVSREGFLSSWASIESIASSGNEKYKYGKSVLLKSFLIKIRYLSDIKENMQVKYRGDFFNIKKITNIDYKDEILEILLEEEI